MNFECLSVVQLVFFGIGLIVVFALVVIGALEASEKVAWAFKELKSVSELHKLLLEQKWDVDKLKDVVLPLKPTQYTREGIKIKCMGGFRWDRLKEIEENLELLRVKLEPNTKPSQKKESQ